MPIRPATPADLAAVYAMMRRAFPDDRPTLSQWVKELSYPGVRLLVDDAGASLLRGYLMLAGDDQRGHIVRQIVVEPEYKRQGVGRGLLAEVPRPAAAWVLRGNAASRALFESMGWAVSATPGKRLPTGDWLLYAAGR